MAFCGRTRRILRGFAYGLLFIWIFVLVAIPAFPYIRTSISGKYVIKAMIETRLDEERTLLNSLPDEDIEEFCQLIRENSDEEAISYAQLRSDGDQKYFYLYSSEYWFTKDMDWLTETYFDTDISTQSQAEEGQITVALDEGSFVNDYAEYLLQALMLTLMGIVLLRELMFYLERDRNQYGQAANPQKNARSRRTGILVRHYSKLDTIVRMRFLFGLKSIADSLTLPVSVSIITKMLMARFGSAQLALTLVFAMASAIGVLATVLIPLLLKVMKNSIRFYRFGLAFSAVGSLLCIINSQYYGFILGYFIITFGDTLSTVVFLIHPLGIEDDRLAFKGISSVVSGRYFGQIIGFAVGSVILSTFFRPKNMYIISLVIIVVVLILTINFPVEGLNRRLTEHINLKEVIKMPSVILFCLLIMLPYGFVSYYIKVVVPIDITRMGLTTTLISFYSFVQIFGKSSIRSVQQLKRFWKKFKPAYAVMLSMLILAGLLAAYYITSGFLAFGIIAFLVCIIQSRMGSLISIRGFETLDNNMDYFFANNTLRTLTAAIGKTIAPLMLQFFNPLCLPGAMAAGVIGYFISLKVRKKKEMV